MTIRWYSISPRIFQTLTWLVMRPLLKAFCSFEVRGLEHVSGLKQAVFALNHANELDPIIIATALPWRNPFGPLFFVTSPMKYFNEKRFGIRRHFYKGWIFKALGAYPLVEGQHNYIRSLAIHDSIVRDGMSIAIFPEGRLSKTGELGEVHGGGAFIAHANTVRLIPVILHDTFQISLWRILRRKHIITVEFGTPCDVNALMRDGSMHGVEHPYTVLMDRVMKDAYVKSMEKIQIEEALSVGRYARRRDKIAKGLVEAVEGPSKLIA